MPLTSKRKATAAPIPPPSPLAGSDEEEEYGQSDAASEPGPQMDQVAAETPAQKARRLFAAQADEAAPEAKHSSGGGSCAVEGVILSTGDQDVKGPTGQTVKKLKVVVAVTKVIGSGCKNVVTGGVEGIAFGLPTKTLEASPEEVAKNKYAKGPMVLDVGDVPMGDAGAAANALCLGNYLGNIAVSFYKDAKKPGDGSSADGGGTKDLKAQDLSSCVPGMRVMISGITCVYGGKTGTTLYTNAKRITALGDQMPAAGDAPRRIIEEAISAPAMAASSLLWSMGVNGFFGVEYFNPVHNSQAEACRGMWAQLTNGMGTKVEQLAQGYANDETALGKACKAGLAAQAVRLKGAPPADVAAGDFPPFMCDLQKETKTPYYAWLVQRGLAPGSNAATAMADQIFTDDAVKLPNAFVEAKVARNVDGAPQVTFKGNLVQVDFRLFFMFDKAAALLAVQEGTPPVLHTNRPAASVKLSKRSAGPEMVGSKADAKVEMALTEVLPVVDMALHANVFPRGIDDASVDGHFVSTSGIDWRGGIQKVGVQVSEKWLDKEMLGGKGVLIYKVKDGEARIDPLASNGPDPVLKHQGYEAISEGAFEFDSLDLPPNKEWKLYYIVYKGCAGDVIAKPTLTTSVDDGEAHLVDVVNNYESDISMREFLREHCIVYAVAA